MCRKVYIKPLAHELLKDLESEIKKIVGIDVCSFTREHTKYDAKYEKIKEHLKDLSAVPLGIAKKEAFEANIDKIAEIISVGSDTGGIVEEMFSDEFRKFFNQSDFIISKGMANYEGLTEMDLGTKDVFCLLCSKCNPISKDLEVDLNSFVLKKIS